MRAICGEHHRAQSRNRDRVPGMYHAVRLVSDRVQPGCIALTRAVRVLAVRPVVKKLAHRNAPDQLRRAAHMVHMIVRNQQVIDARDARVFHGRLNAVCVAAVFSRPARVHQERISGRGNQQRGLPAFHVDRVNEQLLRRFGLRAGTWRSDQQQRQGREQLIE